MPADEWDAEFEWHRDETDADKALRAAPGIIRRLRAVGYIVRIHDCDLPESHDGPCWYESGSPDD